MRASIPALVPAARGLAPPGSAPSGEVACRSAAGSSRRHPSPFIFLLGFYITPALLGGGKLVMIAAV